MLQSNSIGDGGAAALAEGIAVSCVARGCWLFLLMVNPPPVTNLIFALVPKQKNQTLLELYLHENEIGDTGAAALAEGIAVSCVARGCWHFLLVVYPPLGNPRHFCDFGAAGEYDAQGAKLGVQQDWPGRRKGHWEGTGGESRFRVLFFVFLCGYPPLPR